MIRGSWRLAGDGGMVDCVSDRRSSGEAKGRMRVPRGETRCESSVCEAIPPMEACFGLKQLLPLSAAQKQHCVKAGVSASTGSAALLNSSAVTIRLPHLLVALPYFTLPSCTASQR